MAMDIPQFRLDFPEFESAVVYPDSMITLWSTLGEKLTSVDVFGDVYSMAVQLFTAHSIVIAAKNVRESSVGANVGAEAGAISSKTVGSRSVSYDSASSSQANAGYFNQTIYGRQYYSLVQLFGTGCYQL